jgi:hypothetical protein
MKTSAINFTAKVAPSTPLSASLSSVQSSSGLFRMGNRSLGRVQLRGRSLVPTPPARIIAFNVFHPKYVDVGGFVRKRFVKEMDCFLGAWQVCGVFVWIRFNFKLTSMVILVARKCGGCQARSKAQP